MNTLEQFLDDAYTDEDGIRSNLNIKAAVKKWIEHKLGNHNFESEDEALVVFSFVRKELLEELK